MSLICINALKDSVKIESDSLKYFSDDNYSLFEGNVKAVYDDIIIYSKKMYVYMRENDEVDKIVCKGDVKIVKDDITSTAKEAEYDVDKDIFYLYGGVRIWQDNNYLEGEEIVYNNKTNEIQVKKGKNRRVIVIFKPEKKEDNTTNVP